MNALASRRRRSRRLRARALTEITSQEIISPKVETQVGLGGCGWYWLPLRDYAGIGRNEVFLGVFLHFSS
jgi:hypothetical protein